MTATYTGRLNGLGSGSIGYSLDADLCGGRLQLFLPYDHAAAAKLSFSFGMAGAGPADALKLLGIHHRLVTGGAFQVTVDGQTAGAGRLSASGSPAELKRLE